MGKAMLATSAWCAALEYSMRARANAAARLSAGGAIGVEAEEEEGGDMRARMRGIIVWK
jgi:hypothetical protein